MGIWSLITKHEITLGKARLVPVRLVVVDRNRYRPHQGQKEINRRASQIARGVLQTN